MLKIGDVVMLKSGGPKMTVISLPSSHTSRHTCEWFDEGGELKRSPFPIDAIRIVSDSRSIKED